MVEYRTVLNTNMVNRKTKYDWDEVQSYYDNTKDCSWRDLIKKFGMTLETLRRARLRGALVTKNISREERIETFPWNELYMSEKRERVLRQQEHRCKLCGIGEEWNGKPLKLELDHIDGDSTNNKKSNLRFICPNCHQQTPTYKGKHRKTGKTMYSDQDIILALQENSSAYAALRSLGMSTHGKNYLRLRSIIKENNVDLNYDV